MAIFEVKVPQLSESVAEATLLQWKKKVGEAVGQDEILIEIETDKVVLEVPSPSAGVLVDIVVADGGTVVADQVIAKIDSTATASATSAPAIAVASAAPAAAAPAAKPAAAPMAGASAAPSAAKMMAENNLSAAQVAGTGRDGRITKGDVIGAVAGGAKPAKSASPALPAVSVPMGDRPEERVPMSRLRARIAERLLESQANNAILTTFNEVNMGPVIAMRNKYKDVFEKTHGVKLGFMSFFVKAATHALKKFPLLNASVDGNDIVYHGYFDIGIAVSSPRGLVVPILRDVDQMNLADIEKKIAEYGAKARDGKLSPAEMRGASFTISSLGGIGGRYFTPIINAPEVAILGVCKSRIEPVWDGQAFQPRLMLPLSLTWDHRVIDGAAAARFNVCLAQLLGDMRRILL